MTHEQAFAQTYPHGKQAIFWDIENVPIPSRKKSKETLSGSQIVLRIESALSALNLGPINEFKAFADVADGNINSHMRSELQCSNVSIIGSFVRFVSRFLKF
jgi:hypothetical protein